MADEHRQGTFVSWILQERGTMLPHKKGIPALPAWSDRCCAFWQSPDHSGGTGATHDAVHPHGNNPHDLHIAVTGAGPTVRSHCAPPPDEFLNSSIASEHLERLQKELLNHSDSLPALQISQTDSFSSKDSPLLRTASLSSPNLVRPSHDEDDTPSQRPPEHRESMPARGKDYRSTPERYDELQRELFPCDSPSFDPFRDEDSSLLLNPYYSPPPNVASSDSTTKSPQIHPMVQTAPRILRKPSKDESDSHKKSPAPPQTRKSIVQDPVVPSTLRKSSTIEMEETQPQHAKPQLAKESKPAMETVKNKPQLLADQETESSQNCLSKLGFESRPKKSLPSIPQPRASPTSPRNLPPMTTTRYTPILVHQQKWLQGNTFSRADAPPVDVDEVDLHDVVYYSAPTTPLAQARYQIILARQCLAAGRGEQALERLCQVSSSLPQSPVAMASVLHLLASIYLHQTSYESALKACHAALTIRMQELGPHHVDTMDTLQRMGHVFLVTGNYRGARRCLFPVALLRSQVYGPTHGALAAALAELSTAFRIGQKYSLARDYAQKARDLYVDVLALSLSNPAVVALEQELYDLEQQERQYQSPSWETLGGRPAKSFAGNTFKTHQPLILMPPSRLRL